MALLNFLGSKLQSFKDDGSVNASGTVEFFAVGGAFSTYVTSYTSSSLGTANSNVVTLDAAGRADVWLNSDADVRIKDSSGTVIDTQLNVNPDDASSSANDNLLANPSFEDDTNSDTFPDNWDRTTFSGGTAALDTGDRSHGANSMKFVSTGNGGGSITSSDFSPVMAGGTLYSAFDLKSTADVRNLAQILWYDASQVALGSPSTDIYDDSTTNPTSWTRKYQVVSVPATAYFAKFKFFGAHSSDATAGTVRIDNVRLSTTPEPGHAIAFTGANTHSGNETFSGTLTMSGKSLWTAEGAAIASDVSGTTNIWSTDGNTVHVTGTNAITSLGTAPQAGAYKMVIFDGALTLTHGANLNIPGQANITTAANDWMLVYADTTTQHDVVVYTKANGQPIGGYPASQGCSEVLIADSGTIAGTPSEVTFVDVYSSTYNLYRYDVHNVLPTTDATIFQSQVAKSGSTWESGASDYQLNQNLENSAAGGDTVKSGGTTLISFTDDAVGVGNDAGNGLCGSIWVYFPSAASKVKQFIALFTYFDASANLSLARGSYSFLDGAAIGTGAAAIVSQRFFWSSSSTFQNVGRILLYAIKLS